MRNLTTKVRGCVLGIVLALMSMASFADGNCNTGATLCCNSVQSSSTTAIVQLAGLLGIALPSLGGMVGLSCSPISIGGVGGSNCSAQPVCCTGNVFSGLIAAGCTPINI